MSSVPPECQSLAARVQSLESAEASATAALSGLVGADAWAALRELAAARRDLDEARAALSACLTGHEGALELQFVVVHGGPPPLPTGREARLYVPGQAEPTARSALVGDRFWFGGQLPPRFAILVVAEGAPAGSTVVDFRSGPLDAGGPDPAPPIRAEVVVGPEIVITSTDIQRWAAAIPVPIETDISAPTATVHVALHTVSASLANGTISVVTVGRVDWPGGVLPTQVTARLDLAFQLPQSAMDVEPCQVVVVGVPDVQVSGGAGALTGLVLPLLRDRLQALLAQQVQKALVRGVRGLVARAFALPELPAPVAVSIRRATSQGDTLRFQPTLGALGTLLSTYRPAGPA